MRNPPSKLRASSAGNVLWRRLRVCCLLGLCLWLAACGGTPSKATAESERKESITARPKPPPTDTPQESLLWRDRPSADATVLQLKGSLQEESAKAAARGHIGFAFQGKPLLIRNHRYPTEGHNVLQVGDEIPLRQPAPLTIRQFSEGLVDARINGSHCYPQLSHWFRDVFWEGQGLRIVDDVAFGLGERLPLTFRWHLATLGPVAIDSRRLITTVDAQSALFEFHSPFPIDVSYEEEFGAIVIQVPDGLTDFKMTTKVIPKLPEEP